MCIRDSAKATQEKLQAHDLDFKVIPISIKDYLTLLDYTGRLIRTGKCGAIPSNAPSIMERMGYSGSAWAKTQRPSLARMQRAVGSSESIKNYCEVIGLRWIW